MGQLLRRLNTPTTGFAITIGSMSDFELNGTLGADSGSGAIPGGLFFFLTPAGTLASGTLTLPPSPIDDGTVLTIMSTQAITTFSLVANSGQTLLVAAPATLTAGQVLRYMWRLSNTTWYPC